MKVMFFGGTVFIGRAAAEAALAAGHEVVLVHRGVHPSRVPGAAGELADRADLQALRRAVEAHAPDVVVDTRAMSRRDAETAVGALAGVVGRAVVLSSQDVYAQFGLLNGLPAPAPEPLVTEASPLTIPYPFRGLAEHAGGPDYDKKDVERAFEAACGRSLEAVTVLRLPATYGRHDPQRRFGGVVDALDAGRTALPCAGGARWRWTHAHVCDVAHAVLLAATAPAPAGYRVFNVGEAATPTQRERAEALARAMGVEVAWTETAEPLPPGLEALGEHATDFVVSSQAIRDALGFREVTAEAERAADVVAWLRESRPASPRP